MISYGLDEWFSMINFLYDFLEGRWVILSNVRTDSQLDLMLILDNFLCELNSHIYDPSD